MIFWLVPAVLCGLYGILIGLTTTGSRFYLVWLGFSAVFLLFSVAAWCGVWTEFPAAVRTVLRCMAGLCMIVFLAVEGCILTGFGASAEPGLDFLIVLGAQMKPHGPSRVLRFRLDRAVEYMEHSPDTRCIVSGGQGRHEPCTEAAGMAMYLVRHGVDADKILQEPESGSTEQNIVFSMRSIPAGATVGIVTNNFHIFRALQIARRQGLEQVKGLAAYTTPLYLPNNMLREFFGEVKYLLRTVPGMVRAAF